MKIKVLSENFSYRPAVIAWQASRTHDADTSKLPLIDAPVNEMATVFLEFSDFTILEREIFTSARNHVIWARTSRVDDAIEFRVPLEFRDTSHVGVVRVMGARKAAGEQQDQWRMGLPLVSMTSWSARMSYRDVVRWSKYFDYLTTRVHLDLRARFRKIAEMFRKIVIAFVGDMADEVLETFKLIKFLNEEPFGRAFAANAQIYDDVSIALRAQIVRHREITFLDYYFNLLLRDNFRELTLGSRIGFAAQATPDAWRGIIGKRACWLAQADLWQPVTTQFAEGLLPCADGRCPYEVDARVRLTDADPGAPCPRFCNLNGIDKSPHRLAMQIEALARGAPPNGYWHDQINQ